MLILDSRFFAVGKLKSCNGGSQLQGGLLFKQLWTLHQSLHNRLSGKSPLEHPVTVWWQAIFHCEDVGLPPKISFENVHAQE